MDYVVLKSKSTRVCDVSVAGGGSDESDASGQCVDHGMPDDKEWVFPASKPDAIKASDWERRITISLTLPQALGIVFAAIVVVVVIWRLRKSRYQLMQAAAVAAALEEQKQQHLQNHPANAAAIGTPGTVPPSTSPEAIHHPLPLLHFSRDPSFTSAPANHLSNPNPVKHPSEKSKTEIAPCPRHPQLARIAHLNRAMSESDLMLPLRGTGIGFTRKEVFEKKVVVESQQSKLSETAVESKRGMGGRFWNESSSSSSDSSGGLSDSSSERLNSRSSSLPLAIPRGGSDDEDSRKEIEFIQMGGVADADGRPEKSPAHSDASTLPRNSSTSPALGHGRKPSRRRVSETDKTVLETSASPPHFTSFDAIFMPSALSVIEAELNEENPRRSGSKALMRDGSRSGSSSGNTPHSTPKASPVVKSRVSRDANVSPVPFDLAVVAAAGGKKRPDKLEIPQIERTLTNHYRTTFDELKPVGQGGFGSVFQVRGRVDHRLYAVKKVKLPKNDEVLKRKMMRETVMMSTLSHMNIVRYHTAWEEHVLDSEVTPPSNGNDSRSSWGLSASVSHTDNTDGSDPDADSDRIVPVLFIQMEWCDISVKHWLEKRTAINLSEVRSMFVQLLMGIHHMHDQGTAVLPGQMRAILCSFVLCVVVE
jgi:hypothetical protein